MAKTLRGRASTFGRDPKTGYSDPGDNGQNASGLPQSTPGIAVYNRKTLGGYWSVTAPNGRSQVVRQVDIGPAPFTRRPLDINSPLARQLGYKQGNAFPTDQGTWKATYLGKKPPKGGGAATTTTPRRPKETNGAVSQTAAPSSQGADKAQILSNLLSHNAAQPVDSRVRRLLSMDDSGGGTSALLASAVASQEQQIGQQAQGTQIDSTQTRTTTAPEAKRSKTHPPETGNEQRDAQVALKRGQFVYSSPTGGTADHSLRDYLHLGYARVPATGGKTKLNPHMVAFLAAATRAGGVKINAITTAQHHSGSNHYKGRAVDIDNSSGLGAAKIEAIARKFGGKRNFERDHIHLDF